jgi:hypothetical protein
VIEPHAPILNYIGKILKMFGFELSECVEISTKWNHQTIVWSGNNDSVYDHLNDELAFFVRCAVAAYNYDRHSHDCGRFVNEVILYRAYKMGLLSRRPDCKRAQQLLKEMPSGYVPF